MPVEHDCCAKIDELKNMSRRFWASSALSVPLLFLTMGSVASPWVQFFLATPVVFWGGFSSVDGVSRHAVDV